MTEAASSGAGVVVSTETVSVVITCYNHGRFLREAIESVLTQSYRNFEIILVDDGSTDDTPQIAATYPTVRYIHQANSGLAAARNTGLRHSKGKFVVFLDADDRLLSIALEAGIYHLNAHPQCAFVSGRYSVIRSNGQIKLPSERPLIQNGHYMELLRGNYIGMHATVMYRRPILESVGGFDTSFAAAEDYDIYLRIARIHPVSCHDSIVAEYRHHSSNMTGNRALMLKTAQDVLRAHRKRLRDPKEMEAFADGIRFWQRFYGDRLVRELRGSTRQSIRNIPLLVRYYPRGFVRLTTDLIIDLPHIFSRTVRRIPTRTMEMATQIYLSRWRGFEKGRPPVGGVRLGDLRRCTPISRYYGFDRGLPVDRYYIERFLSTNKDNIRGRVLEIGEDTYTRRFGNGRVVKADVFDVSPSNANATFVGDLSCATHIPSDTFDSVIFTQTLQLIYDAKSALRTLYRILKPGGVLLATFPGISQIVRDHWRQYWCWNFTEVSARRLFAEIFPSENVTSDVAGNVLAATAFLQGMAAEELQPSELDYRDPAYQLLIAVKAIKPFRGNAAGL